MRRNAPDVVRGLSSQSVPTLVGVDSREVVVSDSASEGSEGRTPTERLLARIAELGTSETDWPEEYARMKQSEIERLAFDRPGSG